MMKKTVNLQAKRKSKKRIKKSTGPILMERKAKLMQTATKSKERRKDALNAKRFQ